MTAMRSPRPFYPVGGAGLVLAAMRMLVAIGLVAVAVQRLPSPWAWWCGTAVFVLGALLVTGTSASWASLLTCVFHLAVVLVAPHGPAWWALGPAALMLWLGPGGYSIDGLRHARRQLVWQQGP